MKANIRIEQHEMEEAILQIVSRKLYKDDLELDAKVDKILVNDNEPLRVVEVQISA